jgi:1-deoxy-D-xylulose-5-phosphate reductoisomerase
VIERALERLGSARVHSFDSLYVADTEARALASELVAERGAPVTSSEERES